MTIQRRTFLRGTAAGLGALTASSTLGRLARSASAASLARYAGHRSLVGVFLLGGNDGNQLLIPTDATRHGQYAAERPTLKLAVADLRKISPIGLPVDSFGLHPSMEHVAAAFGAGKAAFVCNVGPVFRPTTKTLYETVSHLKPTNLFSHSDMQDAWVSAAPIPSQAGLAVARSGWGGRLGQRFVGHNPNVAVGVEYPPSTFLSGRRLFSASSTPALVASGSGAMDFIKHPNAAFEALRRNGIEALGGIHNSALQEAYAGELGLAADIAEVRTAAMNTSWNLLPLATRNAIAALLTDVPDGWSLPGQVLAVLKEIVAAATPKAAGGLGIFRQVFSLGLGGFDTHVDQQPTQTALLAQLDKAVQVFLAGLDLITAAWPHATPPPQSTMFTMSDFGRTLTENSDNGTDHAWGNHLFVVGNRVDGRVLRGLFPSFNLTTAQDSTDSRGRWIPTTSVDQYVYDLALWLGAAGADIPLIFPNHAAYTQFAIDQGMSVTYQRVRTPLMRADA